VLHPVAEPGGPGRLHRVAHGCDCAVADRVGRNLQAGFGRACDKIAELVRCRAPHAASRAHGDALRAAIDEHLDRPRAQDRTAKTRANSNRGSSIQQLPGEKFVDADLEEAALDQPKVGAKVVGESAIDRRAHRCDAPREEKALRAEDALLAAVEGRRRLHIGDQPHRAFEERAVGEAVAVANYASALRVLSRPHEACRLEGRGVGDSRVAAALVDVARPVARRLVELAPMRRPELGELVDAIAHTVLPLALLEVSAMRS